MYDVSSDDEEEEQEVDVSYTGERDKRPDNPCYKQIASTKQLVLNREKDEKREIFMDGEKERVVREKGTVKKLLLATSASADISLLRPNRGEQQY